MSKKHIVHVSCDICGRTPAKTWGIHTPDGEKARTDLCSKCDDPARKIFVAGRRSAVGPQGAEAMDEWMVETYESKSVDLEKSDSPWVNAKGKRNHG